MRFGNWNWCLYVTCLRSSQCVLHARPGNWPGIGILRSASVRPFLVGDPAQECPRLILEWDNKPSSPSWETGYAKDQCTATCPETAQIQERMLRSTAVKDRSKFSECHCQLTLGQPHSTGAERIEPSWTGFPSSWLLVTKAIDNGSVPAPVWYVSGYTMPVKAPQRCSQLSFPHGTTAPQPPGKVTPTSSPIVNATLKWKSAKKNYHPKCAKHHENASRPNGFKLWETVTKHNKTTYFDITM